MAEVEWFLGSVSWCWLYLQLSIKAMFMCENQNILSDIPNLPVGGLCTVSSL